MRRLLGALAGAASLILAGCGGDSGNGSSTATVTPTPISTASAAVFAVPAQTALTSAEVQQVLAQAIVQAQADNKKAVISVVDRVGNVLAVFRMTGAPATAHITDAPNGVNVRTCPHALARPAARR